MLRAETLRQGDTVTVRLAGDTHNVKLLAVGETELADVQGAETEQTPEGTLLRVTADTVRFALRQ